ncbi:sensor histidine kinase [Propionibacterium freudenreichii]|uniref:histidine kinase n=2 Tax=Propionibacterium freudenreichii TaxID=1744 RepID=A0A2C7APS2_9ACTN|nr:sensor domain-containing protein [Propionibacterium freudenreichii]MCT2974503.1 hypothetical protein [Propionibacterium freudenreichii]SPB30908.1 Sensor histidine kinase DesK [Propionibacterium freudenreichii subsp. shermanii]SPS09022.1 Sensor histidine kinase DesK [Propionibacterium freudenreichii subsp. shermanii]
MTSISGSPASLRTANGDPTVTRSDAPTEPPSLMLGGVWSWRHVPGRLGYLLGGLPWAVVTFSVLISLLSAGIPLLILTPLGMACLWALVICARAVGAGERARLRWAGTTPIEAPAPAPSGSPTLWRRAWQAILDVDAWRAVAHNVVNFIVSMVSFSLVAVWLAVIAQGVSTWLDTHWIRLSADINTLGDLLLPASMRSAMGVHIADTALAVIALVTLPVLTFALVWMHRLLGGALLSANKSRELTRRISELNRRVGKLADAHSASADAESEALRRLERNVHDGPQQQLLRMQMDLDTAKRHLADDPQRAAAMLDELRDRSQDTLEELRDLSRGLVHPLLVERGLGAALESSAERATLPVRVTNHLPEQLDRPQGIEQTSAQGLLLATSELLANVAKHAQASSAEIMVDALPAGSPQATNPGAQGPCPTLTDPARTDQPPAVQVRVRDNGVGGAVVVPGHGLDGVARRMQGLGGSFTLASPAGGPTTITLRIPLTDWSNRA